MPYGSVATTRAIKVTGPSEAGTLDCHAYMGTQEIQADVEIKDVGTYKTPFTLDLNVGTYTLTATYQQKQLTKTAEIVAGQTTTVNFQFAELPLLPLLFILAPILFGSTLAIASRKATFTKG